MERKGRGERAGIRPDADTACRVPQRCLLRYGTGRDVFGFYQRRTHGAVRFDAHTALQPYFNPQESGARTGVQAAAVTDAAGFGLCLAGNGFMLSALPYTPHEVENARRQYELPPKVKTVVRCAKGQLGVAGDNTWGARTHAEYHAALEKGETFRFTFSGGMGGNHEPAGGLERIKKEKGGRGRP
ncbi:MAG: hypothetical protein V8T36_02030 [Ruthenibacterium lactatiformans]